MANLLEEYTANNPMRQQQIENARKSLARASAKDVDGWTGSQAPTPEPSIFERAGSAFSGVVDKVADTTEGARGLLKKAGSELNKGVQNTVDKAEGVGLLKSKESSKTVGKTQNKMEIPNKPKEGERTEYVTLDTPEKVEQAVAETKAETQEASKDKSLWSQALDKLGMGDEEAKTIWDEIPNPSDRIDWLTTLTVYAASRYMGNNGGMALANGLMRGMESKSKMNQLQQAAESGAAKAQQDQLNKERGFEIDEFNANTGRMNANTTLLNAQGKGKGVEQLSSEDQKVVSALAESRGYDLAATMEAAAQLKARGELPTSGNVDNEVKRMIDQGLLKNPWGTTAASFK